MKLRSYTRFYIYIIISVNFLFGYAITLFANPQNIDGYDGSDNDSDALMLPRDMDESTFKGLIFEKFDDKDHWKNEIDDLQVIMHTKITEEQLEKARSTVHTFLITYALNDPDTYLIEIEKRNEYFPKESREELTNFLKRDAGFTAIDAIQALEKKNEFLPEHFRFNFPEGYQYELSDALKDNSNKKVSSVLEASDASFMKFYWKLLVGNKPPISEVCLSETNLIFSNINISTPPLHEVLSKIQRTNSLSGGHELFHHIWLPKGNHINDMLKSGEDIIAFEYKIFVKSSNNKILPLYYRACWLDDIKEWFPYELVSPSISADMRIIF